VNFDYTDEQQLLADSLRRFVDKAYDFEARRRIVASSEGYSREAWMQFAELGLLGLPLPLDIGGFGGSALDLLPVMEVMGEALVVEPYLATVGMASRFITLGGTPEQKKNVLPAIAAGTLTMAFAHTERNSRYDLAHVTLQARKSADGYRLEGEKCVVLGAPSAHMLVVSARTAGHERDVAGISLFLIDAATPGVAMRRYRTLDGLRAADIVFRDALVPADSLAGKEGEALSLIEEVVDYATALVCAEALGAIKYANDATLEYLKTREQFGAPIGSFQALQHRMVDMLISYEQARSMAILACATVDTQSDPQRRKRVISAAKIKIADACRHVSQESVQLHGGMGMSDELKLSHTFRRLTMIAQQFGDVDHHLERFAEMQGDGSPAPRE